MQKHLLLCHFVHSELNPGLCVEKLELPHSLTSDLTAATDSHFNDLGSLLYRPGAANLEIC